MPLSPWSPARSRPPPAVAARALTRRYGEGESAVDALRGVSLEVPAGQFTAVMGPSGSGKSTLMHLLAGLDRPTAGTVAHRRRGHHRRWPTSELTKLRRKHIGFVFQSFNLLPTLTAEENILLPLAIAGRKPDQGRRRRADRARRPRRPARPQAVRALRRPAAARRDRPRAVTAPTVLFADEPTGNLDSASGAEILALLREAVDADGQTTVMVTHDPRAAAAADRVLFLADGRIVADLAEPTEDEILAAMRRRRPMIKVALKGLAARPLRTALTALAIVLGVAMVSGALHADRHDARRAPTPSPPPPTTAPTPSSSPTRRSDGRRPTTGARSRPTVDAALLDQVRAVPQVDVAVGDITDEAKIIGATASRPATARTSASASTRTPRAPSASPRSGSTPAAGRPAPARS